MAKLFRDTAVNVLEITLGVFLGLAIAGGVAGSEARVASSWIVLVAIALVGILVIALLRWLPIRA